MLQHYILIKFKKGTSDEHIGEFCKRMLALRTTFPALSIWRLDAIFCTMPAAGTSS